MRLPLLLLTLCIALTTSFQGHAQLTKSRKIAGWSCIAASLITSGISAHCYFTSRKLRQKAKFASELAEIHEKNGNNSQSIVVGFEGLELGEKSNAYFSATSLSGIVALITMIIGVSILTSSDSETENNNPTKS